MSWFGPIVANSTLLVFEDHFDALLGGMSKNALFITQEITTQMKLCRTSSILLEAVFINKGGNESDLQS